MKYDPPTDNTKLIRNDTLLLDRQLHFIPLSLSGMGIAAVDAELGPVHPNLPGQENAEWLLEHEERLGVSLRDFSLVFLGTRWEHVKDGGVLAPYLFYAGLSWNFGVRWLNHPFWENVRIAAYEPEPRR